MIDEREVAASKILDALENLDFDEGMRVRDRTGRIAFVTRSSDEFCINIQKDASEEWFYANKPDGAYDVLRKQLKEPFEAWLY